MGTISIFLLITEGFEWRYVVMLLLGGLIAAAMPYEVKRVD